MRFGVSAADQGILAEERRQARKVLVSGADGIEALPPVSVEELNQDDGSGGSLMSFVFGMHNPFDAVTTRMLKF